MRVPLSWLREYVDLAADATPEDVLAAMVTVGFEEEDIHRFEISGPVVVGQVVSLEGEPQSNGCLLYTSPSPRDQRGSRMPSSA